MEVLSKEPFVKGPAEMFTGDVWLDVIARGEEPSRMRVNAVHFAPCARTAWHVHALGQTLYVKCHSPGGVWHGAAPSNFMSHIAMWEAPAEGAETKWGEHVGDTEYPNEA